jgi:hypothetical protein
MVRETLTSHDWALGCTRQKPIQYESEPISTRRACFSHYNLAWSPFHTTRIAVASSANYGIGGNGRLHVASVFVNPSGVPIVQLEKLYVRVLHPFSSVMLNRFGWPATKRRTDCTTWHGPKSMKTCHRIRRWFPQTLGCDAERKHPLQSPA